VCGCAFLARRSIWEKLGGFDERFFCSSEDADWSLRAAQSGYKLFYEPAAVVWHRESFDILRGGGRTSQMYFYTRNPLVLMCEQGRWWHWITFLPYHIALSLNRAGQAAMRSDWRSIVKIAEGFRDFPVVVRMAKGKAKDFQTVG
jgi:hypothetical protein